MKTPALRPRRRPIASDNSRYSRANLEDAIYGAEYALRCKAMRAGSAALLAAIQAVR